MSKLKKFASALLALVMVFAMSVTASAASITVNGVAGETYTAYKVFDVTTSTTSTYDEATDTTTTTTNYAYTITDDNSEWFNYIKAYATEKNGLTLTETTTSGVYTVTFTEGTFSAAAFAAYLAAYTGTKPAGTSGTIDEGETSVTIEGLSAGYYFVDSSLGALCILNTAADSVTVEEKNGTPTPEKKIIENDSEVEENTASIGDTVSYQTTITGIKGAVDLVLYDTLGDGLTLNADSITVTYYSSTSDTEGTRLTEDNQYTLSTTTEGYSFVIDFSDAFESGTLASAAESAYIVVTYTATVNSSAVIGSDGNTNETYVTYGDNESKSEKE